MNGNANYKAASFASSFRRPLMGEHHGIDPNDPLLDDPLSDKFHSFPVSRAKDNTSLYHNIFGCYPYCHYNNIQLLRQVKEAQKKEMPQALLNRYNRLKNGIKMHVG